VVFPGGRYYKVEIPENEQVTKEAHLHYSKNMCIV